MGLTLAVIFRCLSSTIAPLFKSVLMPTHYSYWNSPAWKSHCDRHLNTLRRSSVACNVRRSRPSSTRWPSICPIRVWYRNGLTSARVVGLSHRLALRGSLQLPIADRRSDRCFGRRSGALIQVGLGLWILLLLILNVFEIEDLVIPAGTRYVPPFWAIWRMDCCGYCWCCLSCGFCLNLKWGEVEV